MARQSGTPPLLGRLKDEPANWLVTGAAGFIGSNLVEALLHLGQGVVGLDNFATGHQRNLDEVERLVGPAKWANFEFIEADIRDRAACEAATRGKKYVLHQAALGSVPRSIADPLTTHDVNATGFLNMLDAARRAGVKRFIYAASSSTYGDEPNLPKREDQIGNPLSPTLSPSSLMRFMPVFTRVLTAMPRSGCATSIYLGRARTPMAPTPR